MRNPFRFGDSWLEERSVIDLPFNYGADRRAAVSQDRALSLAPVFAATRLLAGTVSTLPLKSYRRQGDDRVPSPFPALFLGLQDEGRLVPWLHQAMTSLVLWGNAYGLVVRRDAFGYPTIIEWLDPSRVQPDEVNPASGGWWYDGRRVGRDELFHVGWFHVAGKRQALSPIGAYRRVVETGLAADTYGQTWFEAGGFPPGTFKNTSQTVSQEQADAIKARLTAAIRKRQPLVYGAEWDYNPLSVPPDEAQFVQTMRLSATQVANIYGIPPERIGGESGSSMTYANVEQQSLDLLTYTIRPWLVVLEHAFTAALPPREFVRFNGDAIIRTDATTRWGIHEKALNLGVRSRNEVRRLEDEPPIADPAADEYGVAKATPAPAPAPAPAVVDDPAPPAPLRSIP